MTNQLTLTRNVGRNSMPDQIDVALVQTCLAHIKANTKFGMKALWLRQIDGKNSKELADAIATFQAIEKLKVTGRIEAAGGQTFIKIKHRIPSTIMPILAKNLAKFSHTSGNKHYTLAGGVSLSAAIEDKVSKIARIYYALTKSNIYVTSGTRTPATQARAMFNNLKQKRSWLTSTYKTQTLAGPVGIAFDTAQAAGQSDQATISDMEKVISNQVATGQYISNHLISGAVDIRSKNMNPSQLVIFKDVAPHIAKLVLLETTSPHWHLQF